MGLKLAAGVNPPEPHRKPNSFGKVVLRLPRYQSEGHFRMLENDGRELIAIRMRANGWTEAIVEIHFGSGRIGTRYAVMYDDGTISIGR